MKNSWDEMRKAKEDDYFTRKNNEALERLSKKKQDKPRLSPITGEPMEQVVLNGVVVDRCPTSQGIWLDAGELEQLIDASKSEEEGKTEGNVLASFFRGLTGKS